MSILAFFFISSAGMRGLLLPFSPAGLTAGFSQADGCEAQYYNPANLETQEGFTVNFCYNRFFLGIERMSCALGTKVKAFDVGLAVTNLDYGEIEWHPDYPSDDSITYYSAHDFSLAASAGRAVAGNGRIGLTVKYLAETIYIYGDHTLAFDLAMAYENSTGRICFGTSNVGYQLLLNSENVNLPAKLSIGGSLNAGPAVAALELHYLINNEEFTVSHAWTYPVGTVLKLKAGVNFQDRLYPAFGLTASAARLSIDYGVAVYPHGVGLANLIGIGIAF